MKWQDPVPHYVPIPESQYKGLIAEVCGVMNTFYPQLPYSQQKSLAKAVSSAAKDPADV